MKATFTDLRTRTREVLQALRRNEHVELTYRGKRVGTIVPEPAPEEPFDPASIPGFGSWADDPRWADPSAALHEMRMERHRAIGMWADREDMEDPAAWVREIRKPRKLPRG